MYQRQVSVRSQSLFFSPQQLVRRSPWGAWGQWLSETRDSLELSVNFDPGMILWATLICVVLTLMRAALNRRVFTVSVGIGTASYT